VEWIGGGVEGGVSGRVGYVETRMGEKGTASHETRRVRGQVHSGDMSEAGG
jgi:hypothetical protein